MSDSFDDFARDLQNQIYEDTRKEYGQVFFDRWLKPTNMGKMDNFNGYGRITGICGDTMEIFIRFEKEKIKGASFQTDGCGSSAVCGSFAAELALDKNADEVMEINGEQILQILGGLPEDDRHCAFLAVETLHESVNNYMSKQVK